MRKNTVCMCPQQIPKSDCTANQIRIHISLYSCTCVYHVPYKFYVLGQIGLKIKKFDVTANSADQDQTASEEAV